MKSSPVILLLLPHLDLGGGARRVQVYCQYLQKAKSVVAIYSDSIHRDIQKIIGSQTPNITSSDQEAIIQFAKREKVTHVYTFFDGQYHPFEYQLLSRLQEMGCFIAINNVFAYYDQRIDDLADAVLFQTKFMLREKFFSRLPALKHKLVEHKYWVLPNPIHTEYLQQFELSEKMREKLRKKFGWTKDHFVVARFGRNDIVKWGDTLLTAIFKTWNDPRIVYLLIGVPRSRRWILRCLQYFFPQWRSRLVVLSPTASDHDLMAYMQMADVVAHSVHIGEACSNAINEAQYWGKVVLTESTPHCDNGQVEQVEDGASGLVRNTASEWREQFQLLHQNSKQKSLLERRAKTAVLHRAEPKENVRELEYILGLREKPSKIHVTKKDLAQFHKEYQEFLRQRPVPKRSFLERLVYTLKRGTNFLEYRFWNG